VTVDRSVAAGVVVLAAQMPVLLLGAGVLLMESVARKRRDPPATGAQDVTANRK